MPGAAVRQLRRLTMAVVAGWRQRQGHLKAVRRQSKRRCCKLHVLPEMTADAGVAVFVAACLKIEGGWLVVVLRKGRARLQGRSVQSEAAATPLREGGRVREPRQVGTTAAAGLGTRAEWRPRRWRQGRGPARELGMVGACRRPRCMVSGRHQSRLRRRLGQGREAEKGLIRRGTLSGVGVYRAPAEVRVPAGAFAPEGPISRLAVVA